MKTGKPVRRSSGRKNRPLAWIDESSPEEIAEALLSVDERKAYEVTVYLMQRLPPELARMAEVAVERVKRNPVKALMSGLMGALRNS